MQLAGCWGRPCARSGCCCPASLRARGRAAARALQVGVAWLSEQLVARGAMPPGVKRAASALPGEAGGLGSDVKRKRSRKASLLPAVSSVSSIAAGAVEEEEQQVAEFDWLIVGLGNPGGNYAHTRHNVGFMVLDEFARLQGIECRKLEKSAAVGRGVVSEQKILLVKPMTFMNNSGESVRSLSALYKVPPSRVLVITDDLDQPTAGVKLKPKGGHGGHNGLRSIIDCLGSSAFPRLKIGIGRPSDQMPVPEYVLQNFTRSERADVDAAIAQGVDIVQSILDVGFERALSGVRSST